MLWGLGIDCQESPQALTWWENCAWGTPSSRPCLEGCCVQRRPSGREGSGWRLVWNRLLEALASSGGCVPDPSPKACLGKPYRQSVSCPCFLRGTSVSPTPISRALASDGFELDPCLPSLGLVGRCSWSPHPGPPSPALASSLHPGVAAASHPPPHQQRRRPPPEPPLPPFSRWPPRCGTSRAGAPQLPTAPAGQGSLSAGAAAVAATAAARYDAGRGRGPGAEGWCGMHAREPALLPEDSVPGVGERPSRPGSPPRPRPLARRLLDMREDPAPARRLAGPSPAPWPSGHARTQIRPRLLR